MKLDRFINRPVLSTVISVLIVILGLIGLATLPITIPGHCTANRIGARHLHGRQRPNGVEFRYCTAGRPDQRCREHDVHDFQCHQQWFC